MQTPSSPDKVRRLPLSEGVAHVGAWFIVWVAHAEGEDDHGTEVIGIVTVRKLDKQENTRYENTLPRDLVYQAC